MDRVANTLSDAANTVSKAVWGEGTNRDETVAGSGHTQRDASSRTTGESVADDTPGRYSQNTPTKSTSGLHPSTVAEAETVGPSTGDFTEGAKGSNLTGGSSHGLNTDDRDVASHERATDHSTTSHTGGLSSGSGDIHLNAPTGPTGTDIKTYTGTAHDSPFQGVPTAGSANESSSATTGVTGRVGDDTSAGKSALPIREEPNTIGAPKASVGAVPEHGASSGDHKHQDTERPLEAPTHDHQDTRRKSIPLVEGHPESSGPKTHPTGEKLPSSSGTGDGTGQEYVKSTGMAAEGGDFDAAAPGAGREADRLMGEHGAHHDEPSAHHGEPKHYHILLASGKHPTTPGKPSLGTDTSASSHSTTDHSDTSGGKHGLGEKIKDKLHIHRH